MPLPTTPSSELHGRRALVVGASRGLGVAAACALAEAGAELVLCARSGADLDALRDQMRARCGGNARIGCATMDITAPEAVRAFFDSQDAFDVLVHSAGANRPKPLLDTLDTDIEDILRLNTIACFQVLRQAAQAWGRRERREHRHSASFIVLSSQMGHVGSPRRSVYCASKHALEGLVKSLAWEWAPLGIRINTVCPTFIRTPLTEPMLAQPDFHQFVTQRIANGRIGEPEDIMGAVRFLAGDASRLMTGSALMLDGGWTAI
jgi:NAD(P)-dependent dehydrogenase (short-subunit alcohol dehydrogenase family)